ncbi:MAG: dTDP-4-dehydrorhamnose 3,5-epimerase [Chloroflexota bacterium]|jgi:dTDP-4-dehydrorhamnose 3,5-epimerase
MPFTVEPTAIPDLVVIAAQRFADERGFFMEVLRTDAFASLGLPTVFEQVNHSRSSRGVTRGLHFQWDPLQGKLMRVLAGRAYLVAVDIRPGSPTLGRSWGRELAAADSVLVWAPASFARGFQALEDGTEIEYFCTRTYDPRHESGIRWDDPAIGLDWPIRSGALLSPKDAAAQTLAEWLARPEAERFRYRD